MDIITLILLILVLLIIITIIAVGALYYTGRISLGIGPTGSIGPQGHQGIPGTATSTGATGSSGFGDFAFVSLAQSTSEQIVVQSGAPVPFNRIRVHGGISYNASNFSLVLSAIGYYQISFGYSNVMPGSFVPQSFTIIPNGSPPFGSIHHTLQEQVNLTTTPALRFDRGGQSATLLFQTIQANEYIQLVNTLTSAVTFLNETSPVTIDNIGSLTAYIMVNRIF